MNKRTRNNNYDYGKKIDPFDAYMKGLYNVRAGVKRPDQLQGVHIHYEGAIRKAHDICLQESWSNKKARILEELTQEYIKELTKGE